MFQLSMQWNVKHQDALCTSKGVKTRKFKHFKHLLYTVVEG